MRCSICTLPAKTACGNFCGALYCGISCAQIDWHHQQHGLLCIQGQTKREREEVAEEPTVDELIITFKTVKRMDTTEASKKVLDSLESKLISKMNAENGQAILAVLERSKEKLLIEAVWRESVSAVEYLLSIGADVNTSYGDFNLLLTAVLSRNKDLVNLLLKHPNVDVNKSAIHTGKTPLMVAVETFYHPDIEIIEMLLNRPEIDVNAKTKEKGRTALMFALHDQAIQWDISTEQALSILLQHPNIDVNAKDNQGQTVLMRAIKYAEEETEPDFSDAPILILTRHPKTDFFIQNKKGQIVSDIAKKPKYKLMIFAGIATQKSVNSFSGGMILPHNISTNISLRRIRDHICATMSDESKLDDLKALAQVLYYPYVEGMTKRDLCLALSDVLALGNVYDRDKAYQYVDRKNFRIQGMRHALSVLDSFKMAATEYAGVDTAGKTLDQIVQEVNLFLN